ncbi:hypothetical protein CTI14_02740 [Methylobacterium radiotolerans]|nr:hypothetical protein CTI14_02740 [Methylobacterium radiotolerans]
MSLPSIDLQSYADLDPRFYGNLLVGNGFSMGVSRNFAYTSLYNAGVAKGDIDPDTQDLFTAFGTHDFEYLLRKLYQASTINKILKIDHLTPVSKYGLVKDALIKSVSSVHPEFSDVNRDWLERCSKFMSRMENVFSLNYDLFPYWIAGIDNFEGYTDFFWSTGLTFDQFNTDVWGRKTKMYYPHGALFIFEDLDGAMSKVRQKGRRKHTRQHWDAYFKF